MSPIRDGFIALTVSGFLCACPVAGQTPDPPVAVVSPHEETRFGAKVVDNYFWLREKSNPKVIKYLEQENAYTAAVTAGLKPFENALYDEMLSHVKQTDLDVPVPRRILLLLENRGR